ncbi:MAG: hypothetical protein COS14_00095 [Bacteroidetes bacterium CG02_land_8_20_14_3_00_31_25]|nr:MAG: hypothetical protein COS14_00095 [Bacteroidetes bacterium CG02_land_8_20_14_3_00_31_25]
MRIIYLKRKPIAIGCKRFVRTLTKAVGFLFLFGACPELAEELALSEVEGSEKRKEIKNQRVINSLN